MGPLGVHVIGELATELVHTVIAMMTDATPEIFIEASFNVPTLGMLYKTATLAAIDELAVDPAVGFANFDNSNDGSEVSA